MGLLDSLIGAMGAGQNHASPSHPQAALLQAVLGMLMQGAQGAQGGGAGLGGRPGATGGGLADLVARLTQGGLGAEVNSWVGTGQNLPVSPDQLGRVLGSDAMGGMARQLGMDQGDMLGQLSQMLPQVVDRLTPQGRLPDAGDLGAALGTDDLASLLGQMTRR